MCLCRCKVGGGGHFCASGQLSPPPRLEATAVFRLHGWQTGFGSCQLLSCFVGGGSPVWSVYGHLGTAGEIWAMPGSPCHPAERQPGCFRSGRRICSDEAVSSTDQMLFYSHLCIFLGFTFLFSIFLLAGSSTHDFLSRLFPAFFSSLNCWASSFVSRAYLLDLYFPFSVPAPSTPVDDFAPVAAPAGCHLLSVAMVFLSIHDVLLLHISSQSSLHS